ncbi:MAG: hypothetical protein DI537_10220 [Stutzerimonas stutzeri]|nr:MAG: hypothetical protein DI537_10220 [Stutzerimonas stutzeri]
MRQYAIPVHGIIGPETLIKLSEEVLRDLEPQEIGTRNYRNAELRRRSGLALKLAEHLTHKGITSAKHAGPFSTEVFDDGQMVKVKAGAIRFSTHPHVGREGEVVPRDFSVRVWRAYAGHIMDHRDDQIVDPTVHWTGRGGYYFWTNAANVEAINK